MSSMPHTPEAFSPGVYTQEVLVICERAFSKTTNKTLLTPAREVIKEMQNTLSETHKNKRKTNRKEKQASFQQASVENLLCAQFCPGLWGQRCLRIVPRPHGASGLAERK